MNEFELLNKKDCRTILKLKYKIGEVNYDISNNKKR